MDPAFSSKEIMPAAASFDKTAPRFTVVLNLMPESPGGRDAPRGKL
jgi:hypothetical protein